MAKTFASADKLIASRQPYHHLPSSHIQRNMDLGRGSVPSILRSLELGSISDATRSLHGHTAFVRRMQCATVLDGHHGCVNRLALSQDANFLLSGSDDCKLRLWRIHSPNHVSPLTALSPGHYANIFGVAFMPNTQTAYVASAGLDRQVRHTHVPTARSTLWTCHEKMVKTVAPVDTNTFISASKDGTARLFDVRSPPLSRSSQQSNLVVRIPTRRRRLLSLNSALVSPMSSHHLLVAANDSRVRIFDLRLSLSNRTSNALAAGHASTSIGHSIEQFCPPHLHETAPEQCIPLSGARCTYATYAAFSSDAKQVVASYYDDTVHVFDRTHHLPDMAWRSPFTTRAAKKAAIWEITQDAARVLQSNYPSVAVGRANKVLEMDPDNVIALVYRADALLRRGGSGDFRAAFSTLERLIQLIKRDHSKIFELWGYDGPSGGMCFSPEFHTGHDKASVWVKVFEYMQAFALYRMIRPFQFGMFLRPNSSDSLLTKKRLEYLSRLCADLEQYRNENIGDSKSAAERYREVVRGRALGSATESSTLYNSAASKIRGKILSSLVDRFVSGIDALRERIRDRMSCVIPNHSDSEFPYAGDDSDVPCEGEETDEENRMVKSEDVEMIDELKEEVKCCKKTEEELWGQNLREQKGFRSFHGHVSRQTDIKEASFYGSKDQVVVSGSDDGHVYMWCAKTSELLTRVYADSQIVNCVLAHPRHAMIISSGIDDTIKIITPQGEMGELE